MARLRRVGQVTVAWVPRNKHSLPGITVVISRSVIGSRTRKMILPDELKTLVCGAHGFLWAMHEYATRPAWSGIEVSKGCLNGTAKPLLNIHSAEGSAATRIGCSLAPRCNSRNRSTRNCRKIRHAHCPDLLTGNAGRSRELSECRLPKSAYSQIPQSTLP